MHQLSVALFGPSLRRSIACARVVGSAEAVKYVHMQEAMESPQEQRRNHHKA